MHQRHAVKRLSPSTDRAVERLTKPHTISTDGHPTDWPALIDWIAEAITEQVNRGGTGDGDGRSPINEGALTILRRIERGTIHLRSALYLEPRKLGAKRDLAAAWETAHEYRERGELDDAAWEKITDQIAAWVSDIEAEWDDRARHMELATPCPSCGQRWILDPANPYDKTAVDKRRSAVIIEYAEGRTPVAQCRVEGCEGIWVGWHELATLGFALDASQDLAVLSACGIKLDFNTD